MLLGNKLKIRSSRKRIGKYVRSFSSNRRYRLIYLMNFSLLEDVHERMQEIDLALSMYSCALDINQHFTPIYRFETVISENRMKDLYLKIGQKDEAKAHYKNALNLLKHLYTTMYG